jgi:hypothetical protein
VSTTRRLRELPKRAILVVSTAALAPVVAASVGLPPTALGTFLWSVGYLVLAWVGAVALFSEHPTAFSYDFGVFGVSLDGLTERRGGVSVVGLPPVYPRNLPVFLGLFGAAGLWTVFGAFVVQPVVPADGTVLLPVAGLLVLFGGNLVVETVTVYLADRQFGAISAASPVRRGLEFLVVAAVLVGLSLVETDSPRQLGLLVSGLTAGYVCLRQRPGQFDHYTGRVASVLGISPDLEPVPETIPTPEGEPHTTVTVSSGATWRGAVRATATSDALLPVWILVGVGVALATVFTLDSGDPGVVLSTLAPLAVVVPVALVTLVPLKIAEYVLANATTEYRVFDDALVAYDPRLTAVQWRLPTAEISSVSTAGDTVTVETRDETRTLRHVTDPGRLIEALRPRGR